MSEPPPASGEVENQQTTTYKFKNKEGKQVIAERKINRDTGVVTEKVDGKTLPKPIPFNPGNYQTLHLALLMDLKDVLKKLLNSVNEINYRMDQVHPLDEEQNKKLGENG